MICVGTPVEEVVVDTPVEEDFLTESELISKQDKEKAEKEAIKELKKKQKEKASKKSELTSKRNELKQIRTEMAMMKNNAEDSDELNEKFETLLSQIQETLNILKNEFDYDKEYKNEIIYQVKDQKEALFNSETKTEQNFRHKVGSKLYLLSQSDDPTSAGKDMGLKFKNGKTTVSLALSTDSQDVLEHLNSLGRVDAASGNHVQITLNLENLPDLKSIPGLQHISPAIPATSNVVSSYD